MTKKEFIKKFSSLVEDYAIDMAKTPEQAKIAKGWKVLTYEECLDSVQEILVWNKDIHVQIMKIEKQQKAFGVLLAHNEEGH